MINKLYYLMAGLIAVLCAMIAALYTLAEDTSFPLNTNYAVSVSSGESKLSKTELIEHFNSFVSEYDVEVYKIAADPANFIGVRNLFYFGDVQSDDGSRLEWFNPGLRGKLYHADKLQNIPFDGQFAIHTDDNGRAAFAKMCETQQLECYIQPFKQLDVLWFALFNTGAWIPTAAVALLIAALVTAWAVRSARTRVLRILNGGKTSTILLHDTVQMLQRFIIVFGVALVLAVLILVVSGRQRFIADFFTIFITLVFWTLLFVAGSSLLTGVLSWPSVATMAQRLRPERHFRIMTASLKLICVVLLTATVPIVAHAIQLSSGQAAQGQTWEKLRDYSYLRTKSSDAAEYEKQQQVVAELARAASEDNKLGLFYTFTLLDPSIVEKQHGDRAIVVTNPTALEVMGQRETLQQMNAAEFTERYPELELFISEQLPLNLSPEFESRPLSEFITYYRLVEGSEPAQVLLTKLGVMATLTDPVFAVVDNPGEVMNEQFLSSAATSGNVHFETEWLEEHAYQSPIASNIISIDSIAALGLHEAQRQIETTVMQVISFVLQAIALCYAVLTSAWVWALLRSREIFVTRVAGRSLLYTLRHRLMFESIVAFCVAAVLITLGAPLLAITVAAGYLAVSLIGHLTVARGTFGAVLGRKL